MTIACGLLAIAGVGQAVVLWLGESLIAEGTPESLDRSAALVPYHDVAWSRLAQLESNSGSDVERVVDYYERAVGFNAHDWNSWIGLGLARERSGDLAGAEQALEQATRVFSGPQPLWSQANFALRQGREDLFWDRIRQAIDVYPAELATAASLCWRAYDDPDLILERGIPDTPEATREYLLFLYERNQLSAIAPVWQRLQDDLGDEDFTSAAIYLGKLIAAGEVAAARDVWNDSVRAGLLPFEPFTLARRNLITNAAFSAAPSGQGFDWRYTDKAGGRFRLRTEEGRRSSLELELARDRPENVEFLIQVIPVEPDTDYVFSAEYQTIELPDSTGMYWMASDSSGILARSPTARAAGDWAETEMSVRTRSETGFLTLRLLFTREPGTARKKGYYRFRNGYLGEPTRSEPAI